MSALGIRSRLKTGLKRVLGRESSVQPPRPPAGATPVRTTAPRPVLVPDPVPYPNVELAAETVQPEPVQPEPVQPEPAQAEAVQPESAQAEAVQSDGPALTYEAVQEILDDMVRPALQGDGGDITLIRVEHDNIHVKLVGACSTCPSSIMTMKMGVEALLREEFPTMIELIQEDAFDIGA